MPRLVLENILKNYRGLRVGLSKMKWLRTRKKKEFWIRLENSVK